MGKSEKKQISKAKKIYNIVSTVLVLAVFVFLVVTIGVVLYQRAHGGEVSVFGYYMFDVISDSMEPTVKVGEVIIAKKVEDANSLQEGDVITFTAPSGQFKGYNITHRIVEVALKDDGSVDYFRTKGDNPNVGIDDWHLSPTQVKAKFLKVSPFITGFRRFISHWYGYVILVVIPILLVGVFLIVGYVRDRLAEAKEENSTVSAADLTDEQKRKLLEEYIASADSEKADDGMSDADKKSYPCESVDGENAAKNMPNDSGRSTEVFDVDASDRDLTTSDTGKDSDDTLGASEEKVGASSDDEGTPPRA